MGIFLVGEAVLSRDLNLSFHPDMQLWYRIGDAGNIFRGTRNSHTFTADKAGRLFLGSYFPGEWATRTGAISVGTEAYRLMEGGLGVYVVRWAGEPLEGLKRLAALGDVGALVASEIDRLEHTVKPPHGWDYLWFLGPSEIYSVGQVAPSQRPSIACHTHRDAAILHKDVSVPLTRDLRLQWSWKVDALPCDGPENTLENHDYVSIAVEFDNGQDLTFFWSSQLPVNSGFAASYLDGARDACRRAIRFRRSGTLVRRGTPPLSLLRALCRNHRQTRRRAGSKSRGAADQGRPGLADRQHHVPTEGRTM